MKSRKLITYLILTLSVFIWIFTFSSASEAAPQITNPVPGTTLSGSSVEFTWAANGTAVDEWWIHVGSSMGEQDIKNTRSLGSSLSTTISGLPTDGRTVWVRLWYRQGSNWPYVDFQYTAYSQQVSTGDCPCWSGEELENIYERYAASINSPFCRKGGYQGTMDGYYNFRQSVDLGIGAVEVTLEAVVVSAVSLTDTGGSEIYITRCYTEDYSTGDREIRNYNLNVQEVAACSQILENSSFWQNHCVE
jgi:hypothetical protein